MMPRELAEKPWGLSLSLFSSICFFITHSRSYKVYAPSTEHLCNLSSPWTLPLCVCETSVRELKCCTAPERGSWDLNKVYLVQVPSLSIPGCWATPREVLWWSLGVSIFSGPLRQRRGARAGWGRYFYQHQAMRTFCNSCVQRKGALPICAIRKRMCWEFSQSVLGIRPKGSNSLQI